MSSLEIICGGCGTVHKNINDLVSQTKKTCSTCGYGLFMLFNKKDKRYDYNDIQQMDKKQEEIISLIRNMINEEGRPPSTVEIQNKLSFNSISTVYYHLNSLKKKGYITFAQGKLHTLKLLPKGENDIPFLSISKKQMILLREIHHYIERNNQSPVNEELKQILNYRSMATLSYHLNKLEEVGMITKIRYKHRSLSLTDLGIKLVTTLEETSE